MNKFPEATVLTGYTLFRS